MNQQKKSDHSKNIKKNKQKIGIVFDDNERLETLKKNFKAKINRKKVYEKKAAQQAKEDLKEQRRQNREQKAQQIQKFKDVIEQNNIQFDKLYNKQKTVEKIKTKNSNIVVTTTKFF